MKKSDSPLTIFIISGLSGSGKSTFVKALEDDGAFCIDHLPLPLIPQVISLTKNNSSPNYQSYVFGIDLLSHNLDQNLPSTVKHLEEMGSSVKVIFLDANDEILVRRYSATRRPHPAGCSTLLESIALERNVFNNLRTLANDVLDTSDFTVHTLKSYVLKHFGSGKPLQLAVTILSFGFKNGIPRTADIVFDVRFLNNPFFIASLRDKRGTDNDVRDFVLSQPLAQNIIALFDSIGSFIPCYQAEGKSYLTVAIGCTGGHHRSVAIAEAVAEQWNKRGFQVSVFHRDINN